MPKHILVAHDLSVEADVAVRRAAQLAAEHDARVSLLHVIEQPLAAPLLAKARQSAVAALQDSARSAGLTDYQPLVAEGVWPGLVLDAPRGAGGFGYDPVFLDTEHGLTAAELDPSLKNRISHRGRALARLRERLPAALAALR